MQFVFQLITYKGKNMYSKEKLKRDINTMFESIRIARLDLATKDLTQEERAQQFSHIEWCTTQINELNEKLDSAE